MQRTARVATGLPNGPLTIDPNILVTKITELDAHFTNAEILQDTAGLLITVVFDAVGEIDDEAHVRDVVSASVSVYCEDPQPREIQFTR